jgi:transposase
MSKTELEEAPMTIVVGLDVHREQITFDALDTATGEVRCGRIRPAHREGVRRFLGQFDGARLEVALEATTGWRFIVEELVAAGAVPHLAEPAETRARRGPKRRAKTDRLDARHLRDLLIEGRLPESWIPPEHILELRSKVRLRKTLVDERSAWLQRIQAQLFHHGVPKSSGLLTPARRAQLIGLELPDSAGALIRTALALIDQINEQLEPLERELRSFARRQPGCRALQGHFGIGELTSVAILAELGDARRFSSSRHAVRFAGLDITVSQSDQRRSAGKLSHQGPPVLRWAVFEAAQCACRERSPDHDYWADTRARLDGKQATLTITRKLIRCAHHTLRELGDEALEPVPPVPHPASPPRAHLALKSTDQQRPTPGLLPPPACTGRPP